MHRFRKKSDAKRAHVPDAAFLANSPPSSSFAFNSHPPPTAASPAPPPRSRPAPDLLFTLPPASDFRTSLILPSLSRRFTLLRTSTGDPVSLDEMRNRFAEQRAKGAQNQITEEEEEMMIEALAGISSSASQPVDDEDFQRNHSFGSYSTTASQEPSDATSSSIYPHSSSSDFRMTASSTESTPTKGNRRHSNNLFGSGRMRDANYMRNAKTTSIRSFASTTSSTEARTAPAGAPSLSRDRYPYQHPGDHSDRPSTPENSSNTPSISSAHSSPLREEEQDRDTDKTPVGRPATLSPSTPQPGVPGGTGTARYSNRTGFPISLAQSTRISAAVEDVLQAMQVIVEQDDDIIVAPRSAPRTTPDSNGNGRFAKYQREALRVGTTGKFEPIVEPQSPPPSGSSDDLESAIAWLDEDHLSGKERAESSMPTPQQQLLGSLSPTPSTHQLKEQSVSPPPQAGAAPAPRGGATSPRIPGYIPGMHRPISPRDVDSDDLRPHSTTPRATSSLTSAVRSQADRPPIILPQLPPSILRKGPSASTAAHRAQALPRSDSPAPSFPSSRSRGNSVSTNANTFMSTSEDRSRTGDGGSSSTDSNLPNLKPALVDRRTSSPLVFRPARTPTPLGSGVPAWHSNPAFYQTPIARGQNNITPEPKSPTRPDSSTPGHSRRGSTASGMDSQIDHGFHGHHRSKSTNSVSGPALPDSPLLDSSHSSFMDYGNFIGMWGDRTDLRPASVISGMDLGAPVQQQQAQPQQQPQQPTSILRSALRPPTPRSPTPNFLSRSPSLRPTNTHDLESQTPPPSTSNLRGPSSKGLHSPSSSTSSYAPPNNPLVLSHYNSSNTSIVSAGSSYHSWSTDEGERAKRRDYGTLLDYGSSGPAWDDFSNDPDYDAAVFGEDESPGDVLHSLTGLTKEDIVTIQTKLFSAAIASKTTVDPPPSRPPSLRRRRVSIGQVMNAGANTPSRTTSPAPPQAAAQQSSISLQAAAPLVARAQPRPPTPVSPQTPAEVERPGTRSPDSRSRANALLDSVLDSIQSPKGNPVTLPTPIDSPPAPSMPPSISPVPRTSPPKSPSPPVQQQTPQPTPQATVHQHQSQASVASSTDMASIMRNKALADAIFGNEESSPPVESDYSPEPEEPRTPSPPPITRPVHSPVQHQPLQQQPLPPPPPPQQHHYAPSPLPDEVQLEHDVRRMADRATAALKRSPSNPLTGEPVAMVRRKSTKRVDPSKISAPQLMSASTSVDTIPIQSPSMSQVALSLSPSAEPKTSPNKLSQRFKKFGTWRAKPSTPNGDEPPPWGHDSVSPTQQNHAQTLRYNPAALGSPPVMSGPAGYSSSDLRYGTPTSPVPSTPHSPPASAGPGLKGFMAIFRKPKGQTPEVVDAERRDRERYLGRSPIQSSPLASNAAFHSDTRVPPRGHPVLPPVRVMNNAVGSRGNPVHSPETSPRQAGRPSFDQLHSPPRSPPGDTSIQQFLAAGADLGLDQETLQQLLARSQSTSSRATAWTAQSPDVTRANSLARANSTATNLDKRHAASSPTPTGLGSRSTTVRSPVPPARPPREGDDAGRNVVVRRTLIFPSDARQATTESPVPGNGVSRKNTHRKRVSESGFSIRSGRSIADRVPTPPPPKGSSRRFSSDSSPPLPQMPTANLSAYSNFLDASSPHGEKTNSSIYDLYAGDGTSDRDRLSARSPMPSSNSMRSGGANRGGLEPGHALELLELSNGQVIWKVVDGLRAGEDTDYEESGFRSRASFSSDYSTRDPRDHDHVQVFLREHKRMGSKASGGSSQNPRGLGTSRPETKVFYSDPENIGRLIDSITKGMHAGSFDMVPRNQTASFSTSGQEEDSHWTMEEHLEQMLGSLNPAQSS